MRHACVALLLSLFACARAGANDAGDDLDRFLSARGLIDQPASTAAVTPTSSPPLLSDSRPQASAEDGTQHMSGLVVAAMGALGVAYQRGGNNYNSGFDCSGFVRALYAQNFGLQLPRRAAEQAAATQSITRAELQPGDLVFFNTLGPSHSHVGIYVGDHRFIHSPKPGAVVRMEDMRVNYWNRRFDGARRVVQTVTAAGPRDTAY